MVRSNMNRAYIVFSVYPVLKLRDVYTPQQLPWLCSPKQTSLILKLMKVKLSGSEEILIECTETRDQPKNKERALTRLRSFIYDKEHQKYLDDIANKRKTMVSSGDRSAKIRTYNYPQGRITDHRINYTIYNLSAFMDGDIQACIDQLTVAENAERLKEAEL